MAEETQGASEVSTTPGVVVQLPCGHFRDGKVHRDAEIIPMTGFTRKTIAREDVRSNPSKITDTILIQCLRRVGTFTLINHKLIGEMTLGDRDFLLLEIRRISMGDTINAAVDCGGCKSKIDVTFRLDEIEVVRVEDKDCEVRDGQRVFRVQSEVPHVEAVCRFPKGDDQKIVLSFANKNPVEASYKLYAACLLEWEGKAGPFEASFFEKLPLNALDKFEDEFSRIQPGPILKQSVPCPSCMDPIEFTFQGSDFLFRPAKRGRN